ncbi:MULTISPECIES: 5'-methylthioadenosine/S-adenosylhomocysteine nucleosidase [Streptomyces]|uniref:5'-methylthioadenosine/S-adenosylhomocysteine nucleosidase n=1 Tax=Streptomyces fuscus TaxID=3048495 RepID=A0ABT7J5Z1_9ACTN|nr:MULTISPECIES: 5'-methylthioadenosine/S-adenosylhomocysteine nucleosidase [Streptomyces]MCM1972805.1 5'-methylthioadenosine/S-adenosylhomocysteine nucleosidase [Streptomyces sp. G1]MDL2080180.1 5'-methylthioadenosine/S-adenosylhomocysteine nucleosidase [Streptomyces fuscus]
MPQTSPIVVVLTALAVEYDAVRAHLDDEVEELVHEDGTRVECGRLAGTDWRLALAELGEGAVNASALTAQILGWLRPQAVLFVGVAGSLKDDVAIGDVVIGTKVYAVQGGKLTPEGFHARPEVWHGSNRLVQAARSALRGLDGVRGHLKPIACGDVVLTDEKSAFAEFIHRTYNDSNAIEMEGAGAVHAAHVSGQVEALVIRGISDRANPGKAEADQGGSQERAAARAAEVAMAVLRKHRPRGGTGGSAAPEESARYGGDHIDFRGGVFNGPVIGKRVDRNE